jgi:hypothetical protein
MRKEAIRKQLLEQLFERLDEMLRTEDDTYNSVSIAILVGRVLETSDPEKLIEEVKVNLNE